MGKDTSLAFSPSSGDLCRLLWEMVEPILVEDGIMVTEEEFKADVRSIVPPNQILRTTQKVSCRGQRGSVMTISYTQTLQPSIVGIMSIAECLTNNAWTLCDGMNSI